MRSLRFESIWLLSHAEKKARSVEFHPNKTLIFGLNRTGKSTLTKQIFDTLGAIPKGKLEGWDTNLISCLKFSVDGVQYSLLKYGKNRALFDSSLRLVGVCTRPREWFNVFSELTGFSLVLNNKQEDTVPADTACFFLPYYINQDGSWQAGWNTFQGLGMYKSPERAVLEYFSGIVPPAYYESKSTKDQRQQELSEVEYELNLLRRAKQRMSQSFMIAGPKVSAQGFENEIDALTKEVNEINKRQEVLRQVAVGQRESLASVQLQIQAAEQAIAEYRGDRKFLQATHEDHLTCPTCGAVHETNFLDVLNFAEDARVLESTIIRLRQSEIELGRSMAETKQERDGLDAQYARIATILDTRRGELKFDDVVSSLGSENALNAFTSEEKDLTNREEGLYLEIKSLEREMKNLRDLKRAKAIKEEFRTYYLSARHSLNLNPVNTSKMQVYSRPDFSGSSGPRSVLAYYAALWYVSNREEGQQSIPVVIDCPNQQGQDSINLPAIIEFIATLSAGMQVLVTFEEETDEPFDKKIELLGEAGLLQTEQYASAQRLLDPLVDAMQAQIQALLHTPAQ